MAQSVQEEMGIDDGQLTEEHPHFAKFEEELAELNKERAAEGLGPLTDPQLAAPTATVTERLALH